MKNITYTLTLSLMLLISVGLCKHTNVSLRQIWIVSYYKTKLLIFSLSLSLPSPAPLCLWTLLGQISQHIWKAKTVYFESLRLFSKSAKMLCGFVTAQGCYGVSSESSEKWSKWNKTIENLSRSFVLIRAQSLALLRLLSWPRQDPPVTIWPLLKLFDEMQACLTLPLAFWGWL